MLNTHFDSYIEFAFWTGIGAVVLALLAMALIVYMRYALIRRSRREQAFQAVWRPILVSALVSEMPAQLPALKPCDQVFFLGLWIQLQESIRGPESAGLRDVAYRIGCDAFAKDMLEHGNPSERLLATLALGHLHDRSAWDLLVKRAHAEDSISSFSALRALVQINPEWAAIRFTPVLIARNDWPLASITTLMQGAQDAFAGPLISAADGSEGDPMVKALRCIEALRLQVPMPLLSRLLDAAEPAQTIIAALRVTNLPATLPQVRSLLAHQDWRVRVQVAKVLGRIGEKQDSEHLKSLLADPEWWVRYCAAKALVSLPFIRRSDLEALRDTIADAYARDMLQQVLFEETPA